MTARGPRKPGLARVGTVAGLDEANDWQERLRAEGIASIVRGHRAEGDSERRPSFAAVDVYVPATSLAHARAVLGLTGVVADERPFPWPWLIGVPIVVLIVLAGITLIVR